MAKFRGHRQFFCWLPVGRMNAQQPSEVPTMRFISTAVHGVLDYVMGAVLIASPWIFNFADRGPAMYMPIIVGAAVIVYSLFTRYEAGLVDVIPMRIHLWLDGLGGALLAASPWLFGFADEVFWPHLLFGLAEIAAAACTEPYSAVAERPRYGGEHPRPL